MAKTKKPRNVGDLLGDFLASQRGDIHESIVEHALLNYTFDLITGHMPRGVIYACPRTEATFVQAAIDIRAALFPEDPVEENGEGWRLIAREMDPIPYDDEDDEIEEDDERDAAE